MRSDSDPVLETLLLPFAEGQLQWPADGVLFLGARAGWPLLQMPGEGLVCEQGFKPEADALEQAGLTVRHHAMEGEDRRYPLVMILPSRQREEARSLLARAVQAVAPGGRVLACVSNNQGAKSAQADLSRLVGPVGHLSKHKCRAFWSAPLQLDGEGSTVDRALLQQWSSLDQPRPVAGGRFLSRPGVFAWDRIDPASALLAEHFPADLGGHAADLGAGFGYLSVELLERCPGIRQLDVYEADRRALELARTNLDPMTAQRTPALVADYQWHDVSAGVGDARYDVIVTNPPFHTRGGIDRPDIGRSFIAVAARALKPGGQLWLVANRHLPYESVLDESFGSVRIVAQRDGFKVVHARKAPAESKARPAAGRRSVKSDKPTGPRGDANRWNA